jgi:hypothetical protein
MLDAVKGCHDGNPPVPDARGGCEPINHATIAAPHMGSDYGFSGAVHEVPVIHLTAVLQVKAINRLTPARLSTGVLPYQDEQRQQTGFVALRS